MRTMLVMAALLAAASFPCAAAEKGCYSQADSEAEQAILFQTNVMVISSACQNTVYGEFRAHNKEAIIRYQKVMIEHFRRSGARNAQSEFDRWNTSLANEIALKQGTTPTGQVCQQAAEILKLASTLDEKGLHDYAVAHVVDGASGHAKCAR